MLLILKHVNITLIMLADKILVTGANGQLAKCIKDASVNFNEYDFLFADKIVLDISKKSQVEAYFEKYQPQYIINCAAYTAVDKAESEQGLAYAINETGVKNLAEICKKYQTKILHISTDYVFEGNSGIPYTPEDKINPQGVYGKSKAKGEEVLLSANIPSVIIRTSWIYSQYGHNFFKTMYRLGAEKESLNVVNDQMGCPTYASDLAYVLLEIIRLKKEWTDTEIYHYSNCGKITWYDFAAKIMELGNYSCVVNPISTSDYPTPAKRPLYSLLSTEKTAKVFGLSIPYWEDSLQKCWIRYREQISEAN